LAGIAIYLFHRIHHELDMTTAVPVALTISVIWIMLSSVEFHFLRRGHELAISQLTEQAESLDEEKKESIAQQNNLIQRVEELKKESVNHAQQYQRKIEELQQESADTAQVHQREIDMLREEMDRRIPNDIPELWNPREQELNKEMEAMTAAERAVLKFIYGRGSTSLEEIFSYMNQEGLAGGTHVLDSLRLKFGFIRGDLDHGYQVNPAVKPLFDKILG
ncbi:MAG TPA: hypothetical protein VJ723_08015, partial [Candidatus Angelobacter sp.]|nr:hypothetical protein [Candidatus Angelobacter sp.]